MASQVLNVVPSDVGRSILDIRWKIELEDVERVLRGVIGTLTPWEADVQAQDGHWYAVRVLPYRGIDNEVDGAVMAFIDIEARRQLEHEMQKRADEFEHVSAMKDEFLALLSHELRTPLSAMLGWTRLLRSGKLDAERSARAVETIERNIVWQARLIEDLLDVSRIIAGKLRVKRGPVALRDVVKAGMRDLARVFHEDPPAAFISWQITSRAVSSKFEVESEEGRDVLTNLWQWRLAANRK